MDESLRPQDLRASFDPPGLVLGAHRWQRQGGRGILLQINGGDIGVAGAPSLAARFTPRWECDPAPIALLFDEAQQPRHWMVPAALDCQVSASVWLSEGSAPVQVEGPGSFQYLFGTEHPACRLRQWTVLQKAHDGRAVLINLLHNGAALDAIVTECGAASICSRRASVTVAAGKTSIGGGPTLSRPRVLSGERSGVLSDVICTEIGAGSAAPWFGQCYQPGLLDPFRWLRRGAASAILGVDGRAH
jgi:hypothetical protein